MRDMGKYLEQLPPNKLADLMDKVETLKVIGYMDTFFNVVLFLYICKCLNIIFCDIILDLLIQML